MFDKKGIGEVDYEEFVCGLAVTCRGTWEEKVEFIFNIYDVDGTRAITKEELTALLNHVPRSIIRFGRAVSMESNMGGGGSMSRQVSTAILSPPEEQGVGVSEVAATGNGSLTEGDIWDPTETGHGSELSAEDAGAADYGLQHDSIPPAPAVQANPPQEIHHHEMHHHYQEFTNKEIVDQAFTDCDLNQDGKLSYNEFRLWVERNPMVTQFLQSVFPYDDHRDWCGDNKHLPFIHNHYDLGAGSPPSVFSPPNTMRTGGGLVSGAGGGAYQESRRETVRLLTLARDATCNPEVYEGILHLLRVLENEAGGNMNSTSATNMRKNSSAMSVGTWASVQNGSMHYGYGSMHREMSQLGLSNHGGQAMSPRSVKAMHHQTVTKSGVLSKQGQKFRTWKQRWYVLVGNCIYYYQGKDDKLPRGVVFLTGSFVEPTRDEDNERRGFWGFEIVRHNEAAHRRRLYCHSKVERDSWVHELRRASEVVPIEDDFEIGQELGKGRFSRVCVCVNKHTLERKAVKIIEKATMDAEEKELLRAEIAIMKLVNHPNIIRMESLYESRTDIFIVMELHNGGELFDRIVGRPRFTEDEAFTVIFPLAESVAYLHEMGIVHRDLKPENILCGSSIGDIKIADFGLSKLVLPDEIMKLPCGTLSYVAPEVLTLNGYGREADIWSVGTIMYLLLRGRLPFDGETREEIIESTINGTLDTEDEVWQAYTKEGQDLMLGMLSKDIKKRMTAAQVLDHPWIVSRVERRDRDPSQFDF